MNHRPLHRRASSLRFLESLESRVLLASDLFTIVGRRDFVEDSSRNLLYVLTPTSIERIDLATRKLLSPFAISHTLSADITPDGKFLYATDDSTRTIHKIDLATGSDTKLTYPDFRSGNGEFASWDIVITDQGTAFFDGQYSGSGSVPIHKIDLATDTITQTGNFIEQTSPIFRGAARDLLVYTGANNSGGPMYVYDVPSNKNGTAVHLDTYLGDEMVAVSPDSRLIAVDLNGITIRDPSLAVLKTISGGGAVAFSPTGDLLYVANNNAYTITAYDTVNWTPQVTIPTGEFFSLVSRNETGLMRVSQSGRQLFLNTVSGLRIIDTDPGAAASTTTTITTNSPGGTLGASVTLTVALTGGSPTGTVTVHDHDSSFTADVALSNATGFLRVQLPTGDHHLYASYSGNPLYAPSQSSTVDVYIDKGTSAPKFLTAPVTAGSSTSFSLAVSNIANFMPTGSLSVSEGATLIAQGNNPANLQFVAPSTVGTHTLSAIYSGDANYNIAYSTYTYTVASPPANLHLSATATTFSYASSATFNFHADIAGVPITTGTVRLKVLNNSTYLSTASTLDANGNASFTPITPGVGNFNYAVEYTPAGSQTPSLSNSIAVTIVKATGVIVWTATPPVAAGSTTGFMVTLTQSSLGPYFTVSEGSNILSQTASGSLLLFTAPSTPGTHTLTATYTGNSVYNALSSNYTYNVALAAPNLRLDCNTGSSPYNVPVIFKFYANNAGVPITTGTVRLRNTFTGVYVTGSTPLDPSGVTTISPPNPLPGIHHYIAEYTPPSATVPMTSVDLQFTIAKITPTLQWTGTSSASINQIPAIQVALQGLPGLTPTGAFTLSDDAITVATSNGTALSAKPAATYGAHDLHVQYAGDAIFNPTSSDFLFNVLPAAGSVAPAGYLDLASSTRIAGWAIDKDTPNSPVTVSVSIDGAPALTATANINRPDLLPFLGSINHGFDITLPTLASGIHRLDVFITDTATSQKSLLASRTVSTITSPTGWIDLLSPTTLAGWAYSADAGATPIQIRYTIDNSTPTFTDAALSRPGLTSPLGSPNHGFSIALPNLTAGTHSISVDAFNPATGRLTHLATRSLTITNLVGTHRPIGALDLASNTTAQGWAYDADAPLAAILVRIDIDNVPGTPFKAALPRPDIFAKFGSGTHGFRLALPALTPGSHRIDLYAYDSTTNAPTLLASKNTLTSAPRGFVDILSPTRIAGWAFAASTPNAPVQIRIDVDNLIGVPISASLARSDLTALPSTSHAFDLTTSTISPGSHKIEVYMIDPITKNAILLATKFLVFS